MKDFDENIRSIKNKVNNIELDEEIKKNLEEQLNEEFYSSKTKEKRKFYIPKQIVAACLCIVLLSSCTFADQIGDFVTNLFSNTYQEFEDGVSTEDLQKIDMDYVEHDGISIKIDYAMQKDDSLYLVFDILAEDEIKEVYLNDFEISDGKEIIYRTNRLEYDNAIIKKNGKRIKNNNMISLMKITNENMKEKKLKNLYIDIFEVVAINIKEDIKSFNGQWIFNINLER